MSVNISLIVLKKMNDFCWFLLIFVDFCWFLLKSSMILADFLLPGSGSGWPKWNGSKRIRIRNTAWWNVAKRERYFNQISYRNSDLITRANSDSTTKLLWMFMCLKFGHLSREEGCTVAVWTVGIKLRRIPLPTEPSSWKWRMIKNTNLKELPTLISDLN